MFKTKGSDISIVIWANITTNPSFRGLCSPQGEKVYYHNSAIFKLFGETDTAPNSWVVFQGIGG
jgi:hypothetical protein